LQYIGSNGSQHELAVAVTVFLTSWLKKTTINQDTKNLASEKGAGFKISEPGYHTWLTCPRSLMTDDVDQLAQFPMGSKILASSSSASSEGGAGFEISKPGYHKWLTRPATQDR
jgi:hypothetical protein